MKVDKNGDYVFVGNTRIYTTYLSDRNGCGIIGKVNSQGEKQWIYTYGGTGIKFFKDLITLDSGDGDLDVHHGDYDFTFAGFSKDGLLSQ